MMSNQTGRREQEDAVRQEGRLPPGQALTRRFPVLHYGPVPHTDLNSWSLRIWGEVEEERTWDWEAFNRLPRRSLVMDIHCVTRWSMFDAAWEGVSVRDLVEGGLIRIKPAAHYVIQHAEYGFTVNLPLEVVLGETFLLATHYNGAPLTPDHGYPLRGVVGAIPERKDLKDVYFWKGAKWLRSLEFSAVDKPGFWEKAGYHNEADIWKEERMRWD